MEPVLYYTYSYLPFDKIDLNQNIFQFISWEEGRGAGSYSQQSTELSQKPACCFILLSTNCPSFYSGICSTSVFDYQGPVAVLLKHINLFSHGIFIFSNNCNWTKKRIFNNDGSFDLTVKQLSVTNHMHLVSFVVTSSQLTTFIEKLYISLLHSLV